MNIDEMAEELEKRLVEAAEVYAEGLGEQITGTWGAKGMSDVDHADWFVMRKAADPLWPLALEFVQGGKKELGRFRRTLKRAMDGEVEPGPLLAREIHAARTAALQALITEPLIGEEV